MKLDLRALRSRVSRRIFLLFFLSAFLPIAVISVFAYTHINQKLTEEAERLLYQESRALGLAVYDRLVTMETVLAGIAEEVTPGNISDEFKDKESLQRMFSDINLFRGSRAGRVLTGRTLTLPELNPKQKQHMEQGNAAVTTISKGGSVSLVMALYLRSVNSDIDNGYVLIAKPNKDYLWNFGVYTPEIACALAPHGNILNCTSPVSERIREDTESSDDRLKIWQHNGEKYVRFIWDLFLGAQFQAEDIGIMLAVPQRQNLSDISSFNTVFTKTLLITGLLVVVLSISLIRKYLHPLERLTLATKRISEGIYDDPVDIKSDDEFEDLGESFNEMAGKIDDQIRTLTMMSKIDHMILSSLDMNHINRILIEYCHDLCPADHIAVVSLNNEDSTEDTITFNDHKDYSDIITENITISNDEKARINTHPDYYRTEAADHRDLLRFLVDRGDRHFLIFPLKVKLQLTGLVCLGNKKPFEIDDTRLGRLRELADRVAVALSNAAWEDKLYYQAHYDALTGLPNRYLFRDRLEQAIPWSVRGNGKIALMMIDLDRFKYVNDTLGHSFGDDLLIQVAERLSACVRSSDTLSRFGGDEFTIILIGDVYGEDIFTQASHLCRRLQQACEAPFNINKREIFITPSIGVAICPGDSDNIEDLVKFADNAMYQAKAEGRGQFRFYDQARNRNMLVKLDLESDLRQALRKEQLYLVYQPKIHRQTGRVIGAEALLRWEHPEWGNIPPGDFIPLAEEIGLIFDIGDWVLRTACTQTMDWLSQGFADLHIAVNISGYQFRRSNFEITVEQILLETGLEAARLELEITENITIENIQHTVELLRKLHSFGVSISIDDFGTGYSSMSYLQQFEIDRLKIDQSFIQKIPDNKQSISIVNAIIALAHSLDLSVIAEGVETEEQYQFLLESEVDELQGYYFSRPVKKEEFEIFYKESHQN